MRTRVRGYLRYSRLPGYGYPGTKSADRPRVIYDRPRIDFSTIVPGMNTRHTKFVGSSRPGGMKGLGCGVCSDPGAVLQRLPLDTDSDTMSADEPS